MRTQRQRKSAIHDLGEFSARDGAHAGDREHAKANRHLELKRDPYRLALRGRGFSRTLPALAMSS